MEKSYKKEPGVNLPPVFFNKGGRVSFIAEATDHNKIGYFGDFLSFASIFPYLRFYMYHQTLGELFQMQQTWLDRYDLTLRVTIMFWITRVFFGTPFHSTHYLTEHTELIIFYFDTNLLLQFYKGYHSINGSLFVQRLHDSLLELYTPMDIYETRAIRESHAINRRNMKMKHILKGVMDIWNEVSESLQQRGDPPPQLPYLSLRLHIDDRDVIGIVLNPSYTCSRVLSLNYAINEEMNYNLGPFVAANRKELEYNRYQRVNSNSIIMPPQTGSFTMDTHTLFKDVPVFPVYDTSDNDPVPLTVYTTRRIENGFELNETIPFLNNDPDDDFSNIDVLLSEVEFKFI